MKKVNVLMASGVLVLGLGLTNTVYSQEKTGIKIGIIDGRKIFEEHPDSKKAKDALMKELKIKQDEITARTKEIKKLEDDLKANLLLTDEERSKREKQIQQKKEDILKYSQEAEEYLNQKEEELTKGITEKVYGLIKETAREQGIDIVLENNYVLYAKDTLDITDGVIAKITDMSLPKEKKTTGSKK